MPAQRPPVALLPCQALLLIASLLLDESRSAEWRIEWLGELWYRWYDLTCSGNWTLRSAVRLYLCCLGCFPDAASQFTMAGRTSQLKSFVQRYGAYGAIAAGAFLVVLLASGHLVSTRIILSALPYPNASSLAVVSRAGRVQATRRGLPPGLASAWQHDSKLVEDLAACSLHSSSELLVAGHAYKTGLLEGSANLFTVLGEPIPPDALTSLASGKHVVFISAAFWRDQLHADTRILGRTVSINHHRAVVAGILPVNFWFLSPSVEVYDLGQHAVLDQDTLIVRSKPGVTTSQLEKDLFTSAARNGTPFRHTAPRVLSLEAAVHSPLWIFAGSFLIAATLSYLARSGSPFRWKKQHLVWWLFLGTKTIAGLVLVFVGGVEVVIALPDQAANQALGGPALLWFFTLGCFLVLHGSTLDQQTRCRVCLEYLSQPIRIGCPGCLLLDWSGTELLCPDGHGSLYVPHHVTCWGQAPQWITHDI